MPAFFCELAGACDEVMMDAPFARTDEFCGDERAGFALQSRSGALLPHDNRLNTTPFSHLSSSPSPTQLGCFWQAKAACATTHHPS